MMNLVAKKTLFGLFCTILFLSLSSYPISQSLVTIWINDTSFYHGFLVLPLFFIACFLKSEIFDIYPIRFEPLVMPVIAVTVTLMVVSFVAGINIVAHFLFVLCIILLVIAAFGRHIVFNHKGLVCFLLFCVPVGTEFIIPLQNFTADVSVALLRLSGIDVTYQGIHIITSKARFYVAEACAGLRFLISNIFICYIFAYLNFKTKKSWFIFGIISILIPIIGNCLRVYGIMMIGHHTNGEYAAGIDHIIYGWGFFSVLAFITLMIGDKIARNEPFIETETAPILPFGVYDATRDMFYPFAHFYEKRILLSCIIVLLIPFALNNYFNDLFDKQKQTFHAQINLLDIAPLKFKQAYAPNNRLIVDFKNTDKQTAYKIDETTKIQISYYHYQNAHKEAISSANIIHNEEDRLLLKQDTITHNGQTYKVTITGHLEGQKYVTLWAYFYQSGNHFKQTDSKFNMQYFAIKNLLYHGTNAGGVIIMDKKLKDNETPEQAIANMLKLL
jgi:exosortase